ncbi:MAG: ABC transporter substrate-binding protein, partial [Mycobacterium sp.]|nr:ABC transporter substrate-binding protein [Mycobacterium sp.]
MIRRKCLPRRAAVLVSTAATTAVVAMALSACGSSSQPTTVQSAGGASSVSESPDSTATAGQMLNAGGTPVDGGVLKIAMAADPLCLDPHQLSSDTEQILGQLQFDNLTYLKKDGTPGPWLATSWTISPDGKTYTFTLKHGVTFSDGSPFNAQAVVANFKHMLDPDTRSPLAGPYIQPFKSADILSAYKLRVHLSYAYSPFLYVLAQGWLGMESPKAIANDTPAQLCQKPVGSGPFVLTNYTQNVGVKYVRRQGYNWGPPELGQSGGPHLAGVDISWIGQDSVRNSGLMGGQYQLSAYVPPQDAAAVEANSNFIYEDINRTGWPLTFDFNTQRAPLDDVNVRKAIVEGVNTTSIVQTSQFGQREVATSYLDAVTKFYDPSVTVPTYNPTDANALLDQAGWKTRNADGYRTKDGKELVLSLPVSNATTPSPVYELLQAQLKQLGIKLDVNLEPQTQVTTQRYSGDYNLLAGVWHTNTPDVLYIKYHSSQIPDAEHLGQNLAHLDDPTLDKLLLQARQTTNNAKLTSLY